jgi:hypothetical protein
MSTRVKSRTWTQVDRFRHMESNQLSYAQFALVIWGSPSVLAFNI